MKPHYRACFPALSLAASLALLPLCAWSADSDEDGTIVMGTSPEPHFTRQEEAIRRLQQRVDYLERRALASPDLKTVVGRGPAGTANATTAGTPEQPIDARA
ncbi:MAG: hypothetical protein GZ090_08300, partial [Oxalobacteraceae bacterium]|nr:hypothetical protein [Oxalobacteraceae bacterium]